MTFGEDAEGKVLLRRHSDQHRRRRQGDRQVVVAHNEVTEWVFYLPTLRH